MESIATGRCEVYADDFRGTDQERIQAALDTGNDVVLCRTYDLSDPAGAPSAHGGILLAVAGRGGQRIIGRRGASIVYRTVAPTGAQSDVIVRILDIVDSSFIEIDGVAFEDLAIAEAPDTISLEPRIGAAAVHLRTDRIGTTNITLRNIRCRNLIHALVVNRDSGPIEQRVRSIRVDGLLSENVRYGLNFQNNGDDLVVRNYTATRNVRSYFVYGVSFHDVEIHDIKPRGSDADINIARLDGPDTKHIKVRAKVTDREAAELNTAVAIGHRHAPDRASTISDVDLDVDMSDAGNARMVRFVSHDATGAIEERTINRFERVRIRGVDVNPHTVVTWLSVPEKKVAVEIPSSIWHLARMDNMSPNVARNFVGGYLVDGPNRRIHFSQGVLSDNPVFIDLSDFTHQTSVLALRVWATRRNERNDVVTAVDHHYREDTLFVQTADVGSVPNILKQENDRDHFLGSPSGVAYQTVTDGIEVRFPGYVGDPDPDPDDRDDGAAVVEVAMY